MSIYLESTQDKRKTRLNYKAESVYDGERMYTIKDTISGFISNKKNLVYSIISGYDNNQITPTKCVKIINYITGEIISDTSLSDNKTPKEIYITFNYIYVIYTNCVTDINCINIKTKEVKIVSCRDEIPSEQGDTYVVTFTIQTISNIRILHVRKYNMYTLLLKIWYYAICDNKLVLLYEDNEDNNIKFTDNLMYRYNYKFTMDKGNNFVSRLYYNSTLINKNVLIIIKDMTNEQISDCLVLNNNLYISNRVIYSFLDSNFKLEIPDVTIINYHNIRHTFINDNNDNDNNNNNDDDDDNSNDNDNNDSDGFVLDVSCGLSQVYKYMAKVEIKGASKRK